VNRSSAIATLILAACGYAVGFQHGGDRARYDLAPTVTETVVADYPYAGVCSTMLEAAWSVDDALPAQSPHKP